MPSNDDVLAQSLANAPVVLGLVLTQGAKLPPFNAPYGLANVGQNPSAFVPHFSGAVVPLPALTDSASGLGALNWLPDGDQIVRRVPLILAGGDRLVPSLAMESLRVAQGASTFIIRSSGTHGEGGSSLATGLESVRVGAATAATGPHGDIRLRFGLHRQERFLPAWKVLDETIDLSEVAGRIVIIGSSSAGLTDIRATPVDAAMPGVEVQAQALEGLLAQTQLVRPAWAVLELAFGVLLVLMLAALLPAVPALGGMAAVAGGVALVLGGSWWAFSRHFLLVDPLVPSAMLLGAYLGGMSTLFRAEQRDRRFVQDAFGRFVSPDVVARLARDPGQLALGGELRPLTVMFTDVRNFSTISERMSAQDLTRFMNRYLSPMSEIVLAHAGTVDKYIGDAIMAFWNAPLPDRDHGEHAARAALAMLDALPALQAELMTDASETLPPIRCGIGLASGPCVVGNLGSRLRFDYSALGDDVNLASRLESLTKAYGVDILATEATFRLAPGLAWLELDTVVVAGRAAATRIFTLLGDERTAETEAFRGFQSRHDAMLSHYRASRFEAAAIAVEDLRREGFLSQSKVYDLFESRCRSYLQHPPADDWGGVTVLDHK